MSRSEEKARASLNRWRQLSSHGKDEASSSSRKKIAAECNSLTECEATRNRIIEQIAAKIEQITHMKPDEACKRVNDEINKLIRVKGHWERQIRALGGKDYREDPQDKFKGTGTYMYFGAAKELPEVRAHIKAKETKELTSGLRYKRVDIDPDALTVEYYGFIDTDLVEDEKKSEMECRRKAIESEDKTKLQNLKNEMHWEETWPVPSAKEVENAFLEYKKEQLRRKFAM